MIHNYYQEFDDEWLNMDYILIIEGKQSHQYGIHFPKLNRSLLRQFHQKNSVLNLL